MTLIDLLRDLVYESGALGALIMSADGTVCGEFRSDELFDLEWCAMKFVSVVRSARRAADSLESGPLEELTVLTEHLRILIRGLSNGSSLLLVQADDGNFSKSRYLVRRDLHKLEVALP